MHNAGLDVNETHSIVVPKPDGGSERVAVTPLPHPALIMQRRAVLMERIKGDRWLRLFTWVRTLQMAGIPEGAGTEVLFGLKPRTA